MRLRGVVVEPSFSQDVALSTLPWKADRGKLRRTQFLLRVRALEGRSGWYNVGGVVQVWVYGPEPPVLSYGQMVEFIGKVYAPQGDRNPGQMDYKTHLQRRWPSVRATAVIENGQNIKILSNGQGNPFFQAVYFLKERLELGITRSALPGSAPTMTAIVWGVKEEVPREILEEFRKTGTYHFLAISGMQVGMIVVTLHFLLFLSGIPRRHIAPVIMAVAGLYALLTGLEPPVLRASLLVVFCYGALLVKRDWDLPSGISAAVLATLLFNPSDLFNPGFQLSLAGFLGLVYLGVWIEALLWGSSLLVERLQVAEERSRFWLVWVGLRKALCGSIGAWIAVSPLVLYYFHLFSPWGAVLSLLIFPLIWVLTISGFCLSILGQLSITAPVALPLAHLAEGADVCIKGIISWVSSMPFTYFYSASPSWPWLIVFYVLGASALVARGFGVRLPYLIGIPLLVGNLYVYCATPLWKGDSLEVEVLDVGHGSCVFVEFPNGRKMVYDAGNRGYSEVGRNVIAPFLWHQGVKKIDLLIVSHEHEDHFDAVPSLVERFSVGKVLVNPHLLSSEKGKPLIDFLESQDMTVETVQEGTEINGLGGARVRVLNPPPNSLKLSANDASCVLRIEYQGHAVLLCGDIEAQAMGRLIASGAEVDAAIVVAPHHGSYTVNLDRFLARVSPEYVAVSTKRRKLDYYSTTGRGLSTSGTGAISFMLGKRGVKANGYLNQVSRGENKEIP
jgi:competence protein ComEC